MLLCDPRGAYLHRVHRVWGRELQPFCAKHWLALDLVESAWLNGGDVSSPVELMIAIDVLACKGDREISLVVGNVSSEDALEKRIESFAGMSEEEQDGMFDELQAYFENFWNVPRRLPEAAGDGGSAESGSCHAATMLATRAMMDLGLSRREAWWSPMCELRWELHCRDEFVGRKRLPVWDAGQVERYLEMDWTMEDILGAMRN